MFLLIPYFTRLVVLLVRYCSSCANDLEEAEEIRSFREEVLSLMEEVGDMVGPDAVFREVFFVYHFFCPFICFSTNILSC